MQIKLVNIFNLPFLIFIILPKPILVFITVKQKNTSKSEQIISLLKQLHLCFIIFCLYRTMHPDPFSSRKTLHLQNLTCGQYILQLEEGKPQLRPRHTHHI